MTRSISRNNITKRRKNFLPTLLFTILLWLILGGIIYFVEPSVFGIVPIFFLILFLALLFTFSLLFANTRRGFIISFFLILFLFLRFLGIGHLLNFLLISGLAVTIELYFSLK